MVEGLSEVTDVRWVDTPLDWSPVELDVIVAKTLAGYGATPRESSSGTGNDIAFCANGCAHELSALSVV
jgi:hypothetical protein